MTSPPRGEIEPPAIGPEADIRPTTSPEKYGRRGLVVNLVLCAIAFGLLALVVRSNREEIRQVFARRIDYGLLSVAFIIYMMGLLLTFGRWFLLFRALEVPLGARDAIRLGFIGNVFNLVIPGAVGGDVVKAGFVYRKVPPAHRAAGIASMVIDRAVGLIGLFVLAALMGLLSWSRTNADVHRLTILASIAAVAGVVGLGLFFAPGLYRPLKALIRGVPRLESLFDRLVMTASAFRSHLGVVVGTVVMSMVNHGLNVVSFFLVGRALFGAVPSLSDHFVIVPLVLFTTAVPLPFGALGLTEQVSGQLFDLVAHPGGAVTMMGFRVLMYLSAVVSVLIYLLNFQEVREAAREGRLHHG